MSGPNKSSPPENANDQRELAGCENQLATAANVTKPTRGVKLLWQGIRQRRRHPVRLFLSSLPWGLSDLAWIGLPNPKRDGWRAEK